MGSATSILSMQSINEDHENSTTTTVTVDTKERMLTEIVNQLERTHSQAWITQYGSLMNEIDHKVSSLYTGDHQITTESDTTTTSNTSKEDSIEKVVEHSDSSSLINESQTEEEEEEEKEEEVEVRQ